MKTLVWAASRARRKRVEKRAEDWLTEVSASLHHASIAETTQLIATHIDEPWAHGAVEEVVQAIWGDIDEAAMPYLTRASALQLEARFVDRRTRRFFEMLRECDHAIIETMQQVLVQIQKVAEEFPVDPVEVELEDGVPEIGPVTVEGGGQASFQGEEWMPAIQLLHVSRFLRFAGPTWGRQKFLLSRDDLAFLQVRLTPASDDLPSNAGDQDE